MADLTQINTKITNLTSADTNQFPNSDRVIDLNYWYNKVASMILDSADEVDFDDSNNTNYPIWQANTVADQQDYDFPSGLIKVKRVEVSYDGTNYVKAEPFDINETGLPTDTTSIANHFSENTPFYDTMAGAMFLYPIPDSSVTNGLKIWGDRDVTEFVAADLADNTKSPGFDAQFHMILAYGVAMEYAIKNTLANTELIKRELQDLEFRLRRHYGKKQKDRQYQLGGVYDVSDFE